MKKMTPAETRSIHGGASRKVPLPVNAAKGGGSKLRARGFALR